MFRAEIVDGRIQVTRKLESNLDFEFTTQYGNSWITGSGLVWNPEVIQLMSPAGLREEPALATMMSSYLMLGTTLEDAERLAIFLRRVDGAFVLVGLNASRTRGLIVVHNLPLIWNGSFMEFTHSDPVSRVWVIGVENTMVGSILAVPWTRTSETSSLFLVKTTKDRWYRSMVRPGDRVIEYSRVHFKFDELPQNKMLQFIAEAIDYARSLDTIPERLVVGWNNKQCDLAMLSTLSRAVWLGSEYQIRLEAPKYVDVTGRLAKLL